MPRIEPIWLPGHVAIVPAWGAPLSLLRARKITSGLTQFPPGHRELATEELPLWPSWVLWLSGQPSRSHITSVVSPGGREQRGFLCPGLREESALAFPMYLPSVATASPFWPRHITEGDLELSWLSGKATENSRFHMKNGIKWGCCYPATQVQAAFGSLGSGSDLEGSFSKSLQLIVTELQIHRQAKSQLQILREFQMD